MRASHDYTEQATALFTRFANRHQLRYWVEETPNLDVSWIIPPQTGLSHDLYLALQNGDELNFGVYLELGVEGFWSYFFPFEHVAEWFEEILSQWVAGEARVGIIGERGRVLQVRNGDTWRTVYRTNSWPFARPKKFIANDPGYTRHSEYLNDPPMRQPGS